MCLGSAPGWEAQVNFLALAWPGPNHCSLWGNKPADRRKISLVLTLINSEISQSLSTPVDGTMPLLFISDNYAICVNC